MSLRRLRLRLLLCRARLSAMDVTSLDVFRYLRWLRHLGWITPALVLALSLFETWVVMAHGFWPIFRAPHASWPALLATLCRMLVVLGAVAYVALVGLMLWAYGYAIFAEPGFVPPGWHPWGSDPLPPASQNEVEYEFQPVLGRGGLVEFRSGLDTSEPGPLEHEHMQTVGGRTFENEREPLFAAPDDPSAGRDGIAAEGTASSALSPPPALPASLLASPTWPLMRPRYCRHCRAYKPPRAHHCSVSRRCVLKLDHWCVWVLNAVGLLTYKAFLLFIAYAWVLCVVSALLLIQPSVAFFRSHHPPLGPFLRVFTSLVLMAAFALALLGFVGMHLRLLSKNLTTIEAYEKAPIKPWPYDLGWRRNLQEVFGADWRRWFVPNHNPREKECLVSAYLNWRLPIELEGNDGEIA